MKHALAILCLLLGATFAHAGEYQQINAGYFRAQMTELREWDYWQPTADGLLTEIQFYKDTDTISVGTAFVVSMNRAIAEWRAEKAKPAEQRRVEANRKALDEFVRSVIVQELVEVETPDGPQYRVRYRLNLPRW